MITYLGNKVLVLIGVIRNCSTTPLSLDVGDRGCASFVASLLISRLPHAHLRSRAVHMQSRRILHPTLLYEYEQLVSNHGVVHAPGRLFSGIHSAAAGQHKRHSDCNASQWPTHTYMRLVSFTFRNAAGLGYRFERLSAVDQGVDIVVQRLTAPPRISLQRSLAIFSGLGNR